MVNRRLGLDYEKRVVEKARKEGVEARLQPLSGALEGWKGDIVLNENLISILAECKVRQTVNIDGKKHVLLSLEWLEKVGREASRQNQKLGVVLLRGKGERETFVVLSLTDFLQILKK